MNQKQGGLTNMDSKLSNKVYNGISSYSRFTLDIPMPEGKEACKYCPCIQFDRDSGMKRCWKTGEFLEYADISRGNNCPLIKKEATE